MTTIIPVPFPITTAAPSSPTILAEELEIVAIFLFAGLIWALPWFCINKRFCCKWFQRWISKRLGCYFVVGLVVNLTFISFVIAREPDVSANQIFFATVHFITAVSDKLEEVLMQCAIVVGAGLLFTFRTRIISLLGFDQQLVRCDLRDLC